MKYGLKGSRVVATGSGRSAVFLLPGISGHGLPHPGTLFVGLYSGAQALAVARAIAFEYLVELVPVDFAEIVVTCFLIPFQIGRASCRERVLIEVVAGR